MDIAFMNHTFTQNLIFWGIIFLGGFICGKILFARREPEESSAIWTTTVIFGLIFAGVFAIHGPFHDFKIFNHFHIYDETLMFTSGVIFIVGCMKIVYSKLVK